MWQVVFGVYLVISVFLCSFIWTSLTLAKKTDCYIRSSFMLSENMHPD